MAPALTEESVLTGVAHKGHGLLYDCRSDVHLDGVEHAGKPAVDKGPRRPLR